MRRLPLFVLLLVSLAGVFSCGYTPASTAITCTTTTPTTNSSSASETCTDPSTNITLTLSPVVLSLNVLTGVQMSANLSGGTNQVVTWTVNSIAGGNSTVGTVDSNGLYFAPATVPSPSAVTLTATSFEDTSLAATATITIVAAPTITIVPTSAMLTAGSANTQTFVPTVTGEAVDTTPVGTFVNWTVNGVLGGNATYGTINANGVYTAPATPPIGSTVTVGASINNFPLANATAVVTISGYSRSSFQGPFAFSMSGTNASGPFFRAGSFTADGAGNLTGGLEDVNDASVVVSNPQTVPNPISFVGTYTLGADGRGTMQFSDGRSPSTFRFVLVNSNQVQIIGFDGTGTATGQANSQDRSAFTLSAGLNGTYVFDFTGVDASSNHLSQIGEFTANGAGGIASGLVDINDNGALSATAASFSGSYTADPNAPNTLSSNGRAEATLQLPGGNQTFFFYIVSRGSVKFVRIDPRTTSGVVAGAATQQTPNAVFDVTSLNGSLAFLSTGSGPSGQIATAGSLAADGNGHLTTGVVDENASGTPAPNLPLLSAGAYTVSATGRGTATFTTAKRTYALVFYLSGIGNGVLQETDSSITSDGFFAQQQSGAFSLASIQGSYAMNASGTSGASVQDITGQLVADGAGNVSSGFIDINTGGTTLTPNEAVSGTYTTLAANGRGTLTLNPASDNRNFAVYVISSTQVILLGIDSGRVAAGALVKRF